MKDKVYKENLNEEVFQKINEKLAKEDKTIREHTDDLLKVLDRLQELNYIKDKHVYDLVEKDCIYHDIGKINEEFQRRIKNRKLKFDEELEIVHNILSVYFIDEDIFETKDDYLKVCNAVLNHHDYCDVYEAVRDKKALAEKLIENFNHKEVKIATFHKINRIAHKNEAIKIKGYLHKCDYSASSGLEAEYKNDFLRGALNNLLESWKLENKDASWNSLQNFCMENQEENIIIVAQTGMGKTEAGLLWIGNNKGFFILPIRTAINAIYNRVQDKILHYENIEERVALLHSSAMEYLLEDENKKKIGNGEKINVVDEGENRDVVEYNKISKQLSLPINISTMDQLFDFVFKYPKYELKLTTLSYSKIVIDEIQMYSPDLLAYLIYGIERITELGGKIAILTATLPPFVEDLLSENIKFKKNVFTDDSIRHNLKVMNIEINASDIYEKYNDNLKVDKSNKILVVCNTISKAQELYEELKKEFSDDENLNLLHSKFIRSDRLHKEKEIEYFGKTFDSDKNIDKKNGIWISTSIVEASLDIDFDYLFTELQDLNSLFQRFGRCNRKGVKDSSESNCYIYTKINEEHLIKGDKGFIDKTIFNLSKEAIMLWDGKISEKEKISLIDDFLTTDKIIQSDYIRKYNKIYEYIKEIPPGTFKINEIDLRNILSKDIIPSPVYQKNLGEIQEIELKLRDKSLSKEDRIRLRNDLYKFTVSVHPSDIYTYNRKLQKGNATRYDNVKVSDHEYIQVIECSYDELGYRKGNDDDINKRVL